MTVHMLQELPLLPAVELGPYRDRDYQRLPEEEPRCELLYGDLIVTPAPSLRHQAVVSLLGRLLDDHARAQGGLALAFTRRRGALRSLRRPA